MLKSPLREHLDSLTAALEAHRTDNPHKEVCLVLHTLVLEVTELLTKEKELFDKIYQNGYNDCLDDNVYI